MEALVRTSVFIHDDSRPWSPFDEYSSFPLFLGARVCVTNSQGLFGRRYAEFLQTSGLWAQTIISPEFRVPSPLSNLASDERATQRVLRECASAALTLSFFYDDHHQSPTLVGRLREENPLQRVSPNGVRYATPEARSCWRERLRIAGVNTLEGGICLQRSDVESLVQQFRGAVVLKRVGTPPIVVEPTEVERIPETSFPAYAERHVVTRCSPNVQFFVRDDSVAVPLGVNEQILRGLAHVGNHSPDSLTPNEIERLLDQAARAIDCMKIEGPIVGFDFVVSLSGDVFLVDINERFNSSTYPQHFLWRHGLDSQTRQFWMMATQAQVTSLSEVFYSESFPRFSFETRTGVLLAAPTASFSADGMLGFFLLAVGESLADARRFGDRAETIVNQFCYSNGST